MCSSINPKRPNWTTADDVKVKPDWMTPKTACRFRWFSKWNQNEWGWCSSSSSRLETKQRFTEQQEISTATPDSRLASEHAGPYGRPSTPLTHTHTHHAVCVCVHSPTPPYHLPPTYHVFFFLFLLQQWWWWCVSLSTFSMRSISLSTHRANPYAPLGIRNNHG